VFGPETGLADVVAIVDECAAPELKHRQDLVDWLHLRLISAIDDRMIDVHDLKAIMGAPEEPQPDRSANEARAYELTASATFALFERPEFNPGADVTPLTPWRSMGEEAPLEYAAWLSVCFHRLWASGALDPRAGQTRIRHDPEHLEPGDQIGRWVIGRRLGGGGYGQVYEATKPYIPNGRYAIKLVRTESALRDEFSVLADSQHPHIVRGLGPVGEQRGAPTGYQATVYEIGQRDLRERLGMAQADARRVLRGLVAALHTLHDRDPDRQLVHLDLKPANIVEVDERWKLADFGSATDITDGPPTALPPATEEYASPEVMRARYEPDLLGKVTSAADIWSFGVTAVELLTGQRPYSSGHLLPADMSTAARALAERCLQANPSTRPRAAELIPLLDRFDRPQRPDAAELLQRYRRAVIEAGENHIIGLWPLGRLIDDAAPVAQRQRWLWSGCLDLLEQGATDVVNDFLKAAACQELRVPEPSYPGFEEAWLRPRQRSDLSELIAQYA
jgi:hypothetical protein